MKSPGKVKGSPKSKEITPELVAGMQALKQENEELRRQMADMALAAVNNERIWRHFADIERILFRTRELDVLVEELLREIKARFEPDHVVLLLCHPDLLERFFPDLSEQGLALGEGNRVLPFPVEVCHSFCGKYPKPVLVGSENLAEVLTLLPPDIASVHSGVIIPLSAHQILFGGLFLGSGDSRRYQPDDATDLLEHLGIKIALCMDNCLAYERVRNFGATDQVTGLLNYFEIHSILEREFRRARRTGSPLSVLTIDLDFVQETGHYNTANDVLKHAAALLRETMPKGETYLARYGSSEFLAVLPEVPMEEVQEVVPYLTQMIRKAPFRYQNTVILIQPVMGVGTFQEDMSCPQDLLDMAYLDLYRKKLTSSQ